MERASAAATSWSPASAMVPSSSRLANTRCPSSVAPIVHSRGHGAGLSGSGSGWSGSKVHVLFVPLHPGGGEIGRAQVCTPVSNAHAVFRLLSLLMKYLLIMFFQSSFNRHVSQTTDM